MGLLCKAAQFAACDACDACDACAACDPITTLRMGPIFNKRSSFRIRMTLKNFVIFTAPVEPPVAPFRNASNGKVATRSIQNQKCM
jgi:hypothetical protein